MFGGIRLGKLFVAGLAPLIQEFDTEIRLCYQGGVGMDELGMSALSQALPRATRVVISGDQAVVERLVAVLTPQPSDPSRTFLPNLWSISLPEKTPSNSSLILELVQTRGAVGSGVARIDRLELGALATMDEKTWSMIKEHVGLDASWAGEKTSDQKRPG